MCLLCHNHSVQTNNVTAQQSPTFWWLRFSSWCSFQFYDQSAWQSGLEWLIHMGFKGLAASKIQQNCLFHEKNHWMPNFVRERMEPHEENTLWPCVFFPSARYRNPLRGCCWLGPMQPSNSQIMELRLRQVLLQSKHMEGWNLLKPHESSRVFNSFVFFLGGCYGYGML